MALKKKKAAAKRTTKKSPAKRAASGKKTSSKKKAAATKKSSTRKKTAARKKTSAKKKSSAGKKASASRKKPAAKKKTSKARFRRKARASTSKTSRKALVPKAPVTKTTRTAAAAKRLTALDLPAPLKDYASRLEKNLNQLERDISRAQANARKSGTQLLREASRYLGTLESWGETRWRKLTQPYQREAAKMLARVEAALPLAATARTPRKKKPARAAKRKTRR